MVGCAKYVEDQHKRSTTRYQRVWVADMVKLKRKAIALRILSVGVGCVITALCIKAKDTWDTHSKAHERRELRP